MPGRPLRLTIDDLSHPAYMVSHNFELEWWNVEAANEIFHRRQGLDPESEARNVFRLMLEAQGSFANSEWQEALRLHVGVAKNRLAAANFMRLAPDIGVERVRLLNQLYDETEPIAKRHIVRAPVRLNDPRGTLVSYEVYASFFREGVLFTYLPAGEESDPLLDFLARREQVIRDLMRRQMPVLTHLAVLVADLDGSATFATELPPEEYFQLVNEVWGAMEPVFRSYYGTHGKHHGDGLAYYFLPQPDCNYVKNAIDCACELRESMRRLSRDWRLRHDRTRELQLNIGLNEGHEWFGSFHAASNVDFTVLGCTLSQARDLAALARGGAIHATRRLINVLTAEERKDLRYGVRRRDVSGSELLVPSTYARVEDLVDVDSQSNARFAAIRSLAVAEIHDVVRRDSQ
jgi:class 3 adenylate cyclase